MKQNKHLINTIWTYLVIFAIVTISFLWIFQVLFIDKYYEYVRIREVKNVANKIIKNYNENNLIEILDKYSYNENMCIEIVYNNSEIYSSNNLNRGCLGSTSNNIELIKNKIDFQNTNKYTKIYKSNSKFNNRVVMYAIKLDEDTFVYINTSLQILSSTTVILAKQLVYVTILVIFLSLIISYYISKAISKPIIKISRDAKKMANGNYNTEFSINDNISELNELVDTLNETRLALSKTDEIRRELLANVSHDLKTPLTMIKAYAEMIKDLSYDDKVKTFEHLDTIIAETDRLNLLVNDILDLSKMQSNNDELNLSDFDLNILIQSIINRFEYEKDIKFEYKGVKKAIINADKKKIEQVIYNLISNAIHYVGDDKLIIVKLSKKDKKYLFEVTDHGKGISKDDIKLIWDKYYKIDKTHNRNNIGTGLGLSIVKNILILHGFEYGVSSMLNKGTTFYFKTK